LTFYTGKSFWLYYALRRCHAEKRPVIWPSYQGINYIFVEDGVYRMGADFAEAQYKTIIWTLLDSDLLASGSPNNFNQPRIAHKFFVIYATSPARERWKPFEKNFPTLHHVIMNQWTRGEIHQVFVASSG